MERFLEKKGMEPLEWQGARIPEYRKWVPVKRRVGNGDVYLVGSWGDSNRDGRDTVTVMRGYGFDVCCDACAGGWIETRDRQHDRGSHVQVIGQVFESFREKKSTTEKWTGCAKRPREPVIRNVRVWPSTRNRNFEKTVAGGEQIGEAGDSK